MMAYSARLKGGEEKLPGVVVIHENRGLNDHIRDVARRAALEGFWAIAQDGLPLGGTPDDEDEARDMIGQLDREKTRDDFVAAVIYLAGHDRCTGKVGCVGFCWGGGVANQLAVHAKDLDASVPFYGSQASAEDVPKIDVPLMLHYGEKDERINAGIEAYEAALKGAEKEYSIYVYEGANHAFHNDTSEARYDEAATTLAWGRTIGFFEEKLR